MNIYRWMDRSSCMMMVLIIVFMYVWMDDYDTVTCDALSDEIH